MWQLRAQTEIQLRYLYEDWESNDYTWNGDILDNIAFGWRAPDEAGHVVIFGIKHAF
jgi:hypothetical protein